MMMMANIELPISFKCPPNFVNEAADKGLATLNHHHKSIAVVVHVLDIAFTEITPIKDETDASIPIFKGLINDKLELTDIVDRTRILLIEIR